MGMLAVSLLLLPLYAAGFKLTRTKRSASENELLFEKVHAIHQAHRNNEQVSVTHANHGAPSDGAQYEMDLRNDAGTLYISKLAFGAEKSTAQEFYVVLDTGSTNLWVTTTCCQEAGCKTHDGLDMRKAGATYLPSAKPGEPAQCIAITEKSLAECGDACPDEGDGRSCGPGCPVVDKPGGRPCSITFGTGHIEGFLATSDVYIGGKNGFKLSDQTFIAVDYVQGGVFSDPNFAGVMGLAFESMAIYDHQPVMESLALSSDIACNQFSFYLDEDDESSEFFVGCPNENYFEGDDVAWIPVIDRYYWQVELKHMMVKHVHNETANAAGGKVGEWTVVDVCSDGCKMVFDTGTTMMTAPSATFNHVLAAVEMDSGCDPNLRDKLPTLGYVFVDEKGKEHTFELAGSEYTGGSETYCKPMMMPMNVDPPHGPLYIAGEVFLRQYYSVYDSNKDNPRVGLARAQDNPVEAGDDQFIQLVDGDEESLLQFNKARRSRRTKARRREYPNQ